MVVSSVPLATFAKYKLSQWIPQVAIFKLLSVHPPRSYIWSPISPKTYQALEKLAQQCASPDNQWRQTVEKKAAESTKEKPSSPRRLIRERRKPGSPWASNHQLRPERRRPEHEFNIGPKIRRRRGQGGNVSEATQFCRSFWEQLNLGKVRHWHRVYNSGHPLNLMAFLKSLIASLIGVS